tara:strand:+ start:3529 stop:4506 length:978 start_codon:yes stop_codon:yes gene_type:complete
MDLYGSGASIAQINSQTAETRALNEATADFNNSLAEQLDQANLEQDEDRKATLSKNITSGLTSGGKLVLKKDIRKGIGKGVMAGGRFVKTTAAERFAKETDESLGDLRPVASLEETQDIYSRGARPPSPELTRGGVRSTLREGEQATAETADELGASVDVAGRAGTEGIETGTEAVAKKAAAKAVEEAGVEDLAKLAGRAATLGKAGVAGLGGALDVGADISRALEGKSGMDVLGSNSASRVGNLLNIAGSSLEVFGVATGGITPVSLAAEGLGAVLGLAGAITEGVGEEEASADKKETAEEDITSQARGDVVSSQVTQAVGRTM